LFINADIKIVHEYSASTNNYSNVKTNLILTRV